MKKLNELIECAYDTLITGITTNSKKVKEGMLFVAVKGMNQDHHQYIDDAILHKASAIIGEKDLDLPIPYIKVEDANKTLLDICKKFYNNPQENLTLVGITGTDGKSTTATILYHLLSNFTKSAYMGTIGFTINDKTIKLENTTPVVEELYKCLAQAYESNCEVVSMEASSEALLHERLNSMNFYISVLTNITEDHLNVHKTIENYVKAKSKLFAQTNENGYCVLNKDDKHFKEIESASNGKIVTYGMDSSSDYQIQDIKEEINKTTFTIQANGIKYLIESPYLALYNVYNLTAAIICAHLLGPTIPEVIGYIKNLPPVKGRFEVVPVPRDYHVIIDYAHTLNSIQKIVESARKLTKNRLIVVTGAAGGREKEKRSHIGNFLLENADLTIFTIDDPRYESVFDIIADLVSKTKDVNYVTIPDRMQAIFYALEVGQKDDTILLLGKGSDNYMAIFDKKLPYDELEIIQDYFSHMKSSL